MSLDAADPDGKHSNDALKKKARSLEEVREFVDQWTQEAEESAKKIIEGMERDKFQVYVGKDSRMMNILYRIHPRWATNFMSKQMKALLGV